MDIFDIIYTILIKPLELLFEAVFSISYGIYENPTVCLIIISLAINIIVLPLYRRADIIQQNARKKENEMRPLTDHIKKAFKGDERIMMLQTLYRQQNYSTLSSMKSLISLVLQIPFFIAAYKFLSELAVLDGAKMGPIRDLARPDALLTIGGITINVLPVAMTVINIISSEIYTKGQPFKDKIVLYLSALIFLVLLYDSPSGLVFYWTFNNVFSLVKNIFYKLRDPGLVFKVICALAGITGAVFLIIYSKKLGYSKVSLLMLICVAAILPLSALILRGKKAKKEVKITSADKILYLFCSLYLSVLLGMHIPSAVINSSAEDFMYISKMFDPSAYVWYSLQISFGVFFCWMGVFYLLASDSGRKLFTNVLLAYAVIATADYMFFGMTLGTMSPELGLDSALKYTLGDNFLNVSVLLFIVIIALIIRRFLPRVMTSIAIAVTIVAVATGAYNIVSINKAYNEALAKTGGGQMPKITMTRTGKNVMVLMIDRAIGCLVPYMFEEKPELYEMFDGFTYYPNTISFGGHTNFGAPALFGGYEYTPANMNRRDDVLLKDKHNEALLLMPLLFRDNGYHITVMDPPYANYSEMTDLSIFEKYDGMDAYAAEGRMNYYSDEILYQSDKARYRNFFCYSIFKTSPLPFQDALYNNGKYNSLPKKTMTGPDPTFHYPQSVSTPSKTLGIRGSFMDSYSVLENLSVITEVTDDSKDQFFYMDNNTAHMITVLKEPEFIPYDRVDNTEYDRQHLVREYNGRKLNCSTYDEVAHYHVNMAAFLKLGEWFRYMKLNGVWDNTRIIVVADHGFCVGHLDCMVHKDLAIDAEYVNPVLMIKDFGSKGFNTNYDFMTNADVPTMTMDGIITNPVNPFTGNPVNNLEKFKERQCIIYSEKWKVTDNDGYRFLPGRWFTVHGDIYERSNWEYLGEY
ncbi:MAG: YidC/Oxa1 family membrane protein insertase [Clostridiales bacterium]|nr:YidC/Oxa1 family membrane protein insertase [Clostridiales bacterium]